MPEIQTQTLSTESECRRQLAHAQAQLERVTSQMEVCHRAADELNHRVANNLQIATNFLLLQQSRLDDEAAKAALTTASFRIGAVAKLHRHMASQAASATVDLGRVLEQVGPEMASSTGLTCEVHADPVEVSGAAAVQLVIAVNELVINAGKHAYADGGGGMVHIDCRRRSDGVIQLSVADGGPGLTEGFTLDGHKGLGFTILNAIVRQLGGEILAETDGGARFTLCVPASTFS